MAVGQEHPGGQVHRRAGSSSGALRPRSAAGRKARSRATVSDPAAKVNHAWFRGGWWDPLTMAWKDIAAGRMLRTPAGDRRRAVARRYPVCAVHARARRGQDHRAAAGVACRSRQTCDLGKDPEPSRTSPRVVPGTYRPWYAGRFANIDEVTAYWREHYNELRAKTQAVQRLFLRLHAAARSHRRRGRQPDHPEIAHRAAPGRRPLVGLGGLRRQFRLLPRLLHARLELRPGHAAPVPGAGTHAARNRVRSVPGRTRPSNVPQRACRSGPWCTTSTPRPTGSWAAS